MFFNHWVAAHTQCVMRAHQVSLGELSDFTYRNWSLQNTFFRALCVRPVFLQGYQPRPEHQRGAVPTQICQNRVFSSQFLVNFCSRNITIYRLGIWTTTCWIIYNWSTWTKIFSKRCQEDRLKKYRFDTCGHAFSFINWEAAMCCEPGCMTFLFVSRQFEFL